MSSPAEDVRTKQRLVAGSHCSGRESTWPKAPGRCDASWQSSNTITQQTAKQGGRALFRESIEFGEASLGRGHPQIIVRLNNLALLLQSENRTKEAKSLYKEAIDGSEKCLGEEHVYVGLACKILPTCFATPVGERRRTALCAGDRYRCRTSASITSSQPARAPRREAFARGWAYQRRAGDAQAALAVHRKAFGENHRWTQDSKKAVEACVDEMERQPGAGSSLKLYFGGQSGGVKGSLYGVLQDFR